MVKRTGNIFLLCLFSSLFCFGDAPQILLSVTDSWNNPFDYVARQQAFTLHVQVKNMGDAFDPPDKIPGAETCLVSRSGSSRSTSIINGVRDESLTYNYVVRAKKEGKFTFGPIEAIAPDGSVVTSNAVTVLVSDHPLVHTSKQDPFFFEATIDKSQVYLHEQVMITYRFYYKYNHKQLEVEEPHYEGFQVGWRSSSFSHGKKLIDGNEYLYKEFQVELFPQKIGNLEILPARALYFDGSSHGNAFGGLMGAFFANKKESYSKVIDLEVLDLPAHPDGKSVLAIGEFSRLDFSVDEYDVDVGKGIVAHYTIQGNGNVRLLPFPKLNLPGSIKSYFSTDQVRKSKNGEREKIYEAIVQGSSPGTFEIPAQEFIYFSPQEKRYKKLTSEPFSMRFSGDEIVVESEEELEEVFEEELVDALEEKTHHFKDWQIDEIYSGNQIHFHTPRMPDSLFVRLIFFLFVVLFISICFVHWHYIVCWFLRYHWFQKWYVAILFLRLQRGNSARDIYELHVFFFKKHGGDLQNNLGIPFLKKYGYSSEEISVWKQYINQLIRMIYDKDTEYNNGFLAESKKMFQVFFKKMRG